MHYDNPSKKLPLGKGSRNGESITVDESYNIFVYILNLIASYDYNIILESNNYNNLSNLEHNSELELSSSIKSKSFNKIYELNDDNIKDISIIVCIGGDGTLLWANKYFFNSKMPPCICISAGTLGFMMDHTLDTYQQSVTAIFSNNYKYIKIDRNLITGQVTNINKSNPSTNSSSEVTKTVIQHNYINEVVISRHNGSMIMLDVYMDGLNISTVWADGLIVATSNGSTAYSLSANGSIVHPAVRCILITPICPFTLSARPMILPACTLRIKVSKQSRADGLLSIDGNTEYYLHKDDQVEIRVSEDKVERLVTHDGDYDWCKIVGEKLGWMKYG
eukprot:Mrub_05988.p1 GENE.Mrub_05988~~Mrub_05988.p1  ORF type:complete len:344 (+),score=84.07 Mrub_05988:33-1034(+)